MKQDNVSQVSYADSTLGNIHSRKSKQLDAEILAKLWNIDRKKALKTIKRTTHRGIRSCLHPSLYRHFPTNYCIMRYNCLPHSMLSDTMKSGVVSKRRNKYGQVYCTQYRWSWCHPIKLKSESHEYLSMLFKHDCVPPNIVVDNSKEQ